jgi:TRAP-type C4-dicarboxylate transport system permease small subunit
VFERLEKALQYGYSMLAAVAVFVTVEVVMRYVFHSPHTWFDEVAILSVMLGTFLGMGVATTQRKHIGVGVLYERLSDKTQRLLEVLYALLTLVLSGVVSVALLMWASFLNSIGAHYDSTLGTPLSAICYILVVGMVFAAVGSVRILVHK